MELLKIPALSKLSVNKNLDCHLAGIVQGSPVEEQLLCSVEAAHRPAAGM